MLIGIDVGGTTTDAVLTHRRSVLAEAAVATQPEDLTGSVLAALDSVMVDVRPADIERVVLSTTVITNLLAENKADRVGLILEPGPGANPHDYGLPRAHIVGGAVDYRGREIAALDEAAVIEAGAELKADGISKVAVVGKFCQRNPAHERKAKRILAASHPDLVVECGHLVSARLNFPRRAATTLLTLATRDRYKEFASAMTNAIRERGVTAPIFVLKADGGTLPLGYSLRIPVETIFSGPAASTMGAVALSARDESFILVDVGGTTTDLALVLNGKPLLSSKGARVDNLLTHVRSFAVKSVAVGGDSAVRASRDGVAIGPVRMGPPACLGGPVPTPTDAFRVLGEVSLGDQDAARRAMADLGGQLRMGPEDAAQVVLEEMARHIAAEVDDMFVHWRDEPVYRIWQLVHEKRERPGLLIGVGGAAPAVAPAVAGLLGTRCRVPEHAPVANALGAAISRPTLNLTLSMDTHQGTWVVEEDGTVGRLEDEKLSLAGAERMALEMLAWRAEEAGIGDYAAEALVTHSEVFNMVRGYSTIGRLLDVTVEIPAGVLEEWSGNHDR